MKAAAVVVGAAVVVAAVVVAAAVGVIVCAHMRACVVGWVDTLVGE